MWETGADAAAEWEVDVSGLTISVARAAVRYTLRRIVEGKHPEQQLRRPRLHHGSRSTRPPRERVVEQSRLPQVRAVERAQANEGALREHLLGYLRDDFEPALSPSIPAQMPGTILVTASASRTTWCLPMCGSSPKSKGVSMRERDERHALIEASRGAPPNGAMGASQVALR